MQLTAFEQSLVADAAMGKQLDAVKDRVMDVSVGAQWGRERTVRAEVLEALVTGALGTVHRRGVQLRGGRVQGALDLSWSDLAEPLSLIECYFDEPILASGARLRHLVLSQSRVTGLDLSLATVQGSVRLDEGFTVTGEVRLADAEIDGFLTCRGATLSNAGGYAFNADGATFRDGVFFDHGLATTGEVRLVGARIGGQLSCRGATLSNVGGYAFNADGATFRDGVFFDEGFSATGEIRLVGADIGGEFNCRGATLSNVGGHALDVERATIKGSVILNEDFAATGEVRLVGADIGGLDCRRARLRNDNGHALSGERMTVNGGVVLDHGFSATGEVRLGGATIVGQLSCRAARLDNAAGVALNADGVVVEEDVFLDQGFSATGEVRLPGADIGGQLNCRGATMGNVGGVAFNAEGMAVKGHVFLDQGFSATGEVRLPGADIGGQLNCRGATIYGVSGDALNAQGAAVKGGTLLDHGFSCTGVVCFSGAHLGVFLWDDQHVTGILDLRSTTVRQLGDRWGQPLKKKNGGVRLTGFRYDSFIEGAGDSVDFRLAWIRSSAGYTPQAYTQLAEVYRRSGHDDRARKVLINREIDRRRRAQPSVFSRSKSLLLGATVAHGYKPGRAVWFLVALWVSGVALFLGDPGRQAMVPTKATAVTEQAPSSAVGQQATGLPCPPRPPRYPCFNPWVYSAETVVPLIELGQAANWQPAGGAGRYQIWVWTATALGWLFTTLGVAGVTGVIRKD